MGDRYTFSFTQLKCENKHSFRGYVENEEDDGTCTTTFQACPTCGGETQEDRGKEVSDAFAGLFHPFDYEGVHYSTQEQWDAKRKEVADAQMVPVDRIQIMPHDPAASKVRAEEAAHRGWMNRRRSGGEQAYREHVQDQRRLSGKDERIIVGYRGPRS